MKKISPAEKIAALIFLCSLIQPLTPLAQASLANSGLPPIQSFLEAMTPDGMVVNIEKGIAPKDLLFVDSAIVGSRYLLLSNYNNLFLLDFASMELRTMKIIGAKKLLNTFMGLFYNEYTGRLYVSGDSANYFLICKPLLEQSLCQVEEVVATIDIAEPKAIATDRSGDTVYLANYESGKVTALGRAASGWIKRWDVDFFGAHGLALDDESIWATSPGADHVIKINRQTGKKQAAIKSSSLKSSYAAFEHPSQLEVSGKYLLVTDPGLGGVLVLDKENFSLVRIIGQNAPGSFGLNWPYESTIFADKLFAVSTFGSRIVIFDMKTGNAESVLFFGQRTWDYAFETAPYIQNRHPHPDNIFDSNVNTNAPLLKYFGKSYYTAPIVSKAVDSDGYLVMPRYSTLLNDWTLLKDTYVIPFDNRSTFLVSPQAPLLLHQYSQACPILQSFRIPLDSWPSKDGGGIITPQGPLDLTQMHKVAIERLRTYERKVKHEELVSDEVILEFFKPSFERIDNAPVNNNLIKRSLYSSIGKQLYDEANSCVGKQCGFFERHDKLRIIINWIRRSFYSSEGKQLYNESNSCAGKKCGFFELHDKLRSIIKKIPDPANSMSMEEISLLILKFGGCEHLRKSA